MELLRRLWIEEDGQGITEYSLILGLVVLAVWLLVTNSGIGTAISALFGRVATEVNGCVANSCP